MSFVSTTFVLFASAFYAIYFIAPARWRLYVLLASSYIFCGFFSHWFTFVLLASTAGNYACVRIMARDPGRSRQAMIAGICLNVALLLSFKYVNFVRSSYLDTVGFFSGNAASYEALAILVPIGISFYTFQSISVLVDVHRGKLRAPTLLELAVLLAFWPKLIAGPIVRGTQLIPQMQTPRRFRWVNLWLGAEAIVYGLALKTMLADYLAPEVNKVYSSPASYSAIDCLAAAFLYTFQIYGDFAGYSLMAIGLARFAGYTIGPNFRRPNFATSFGDFWQRWHISLSNFLGSYVYRSLPYKGPREYVRSRNTIITMLISGLWHGPAWTFVTWGGMHGVLLVLGRFLSRATAPLYAGRLWLARLSLPFQMLGVFVMVAITRIFFRSGSIGEAWSICKQIVQGPIRLGDLQNPMSVVICLVIIAGVTGCEAVVEYGFWRRWKRWRTIRVAWPVAVLLVSTLIGEFEGGQFVYVRF